MGGAKLTVLLEAEALMPPLRRGSGTRAADDAIGDGGALALGLVLVLVPAPASRRGGRPEPERSEPSHPRYSSFRVRPRRGLGEGRAPPQPSRSRHGVRSGGHVMRAAVRLNEAGTEAASAEAETVVPTRRRFGREGGRGCHDGGADSAPSGGEEQEEVVALAPAARAWRRRVEASCAPIGPPLLAMASPGRRWTERLMVVGWWLLCGEATSSEIQNLGKGGGARIDCKPGKENWGFGGPVIFTKAPLEKKNRGIFVVAALVFQSHLPLDPSLAISVISSSITVFLKKNLCVTFNIS